MSIQRSENKGQITVTQGFAIQFGEVNPLFLWWVIIRIGKYPLFGGEGLFTYIAKQCNQANGPRHRDTTASVPFHPMLPFELKDQLSNYQPAPRNGFQIHPDNTLKNHEPKCFLCSLFEHRVSCSKNGYLFWGLSHWPVLSALLIWMNGIWSFPSLSEGIQPEMFICI